ncbi:MAG: hypothetical protein IKR92_03085 [Alphaproteobacteria bacterium]|nr:hypothetical protein [Alphaproteobacteria bacterium]
MFVKRKIVAQSYKSAVAQLGTNFWGGTPENNYGFGTSNISQNIENVTNRLNNSGFGGGMNSQSSYGGKKITFRSGVQRL